MVILSAGGLVSSPNPSRDPAILSDLYPMQNQYQLYGNAQGLTLSDGFALYGEIYRTQPQVQTVVTKIAYGMSRVRMAVQETNTDGDIADVTDSSDFGRLLSSPNPKYSPAFVYVWNYSTFEIYGETIMIKQRESRGAPPFALWPMHPANVVTQRDVETGVLWYLLYVGVPASGSPVLAYPESDVVHIRSYNPDTMVRGLSRLEALRGDLTNIAAMRQAQTAFWNKGARPATLLQAPGKLSQRALNRLKAQWDAMYAGAESWGKTAVLEEGVTASFHPMNLVELQSVETVQLTWQEACSLYDVPPPAIQIIDHANYSNVQEELRSLYRETFGARLDFFASELNFQLGQEFSTGRLTMHYDTESITRANPEALMDLYQKGVQSGVFKPAEARKAFKLPAAGPEADQLYANAALVPLGTDRAGKPMDATGSQQGEGGTDAAVGRPDGGQPPSQTPGAAQPDTTAAPAPKAIDRPVLKVARLCGSCELPQSDRLSRRGWCRSCEGKAGRRKAVAT